MRVAAALVKCEMELAKLEFKRDGQRLLLGGLLLGVGAYCEAEAVVIPVRMARAEDMPALVRLRLANAERHVALDPHGHRLPEPEAVRRYFEELLSSPDEPVVGAKVVSPRSQVMVAWMASAYWGGGQVARWARRPAGRPWAARSRAVVSS